jgi:hypothetical protein
MRKKSKPKSISSFTPAKELAVRAPLILSDFMKNLTFILVLVLLCGFIVIQVFIASLEPDLVISSDPSGTVTDQQFAFIEGEVDLRANISINDTPVVTDDRGNFSKSVILHPGANTFFVRAHDQANNVNEIEHILIYQP